MQEAEFKAWLAERGANTENGRNTRVHAVRTIENNLAALDSPHSDLAEAWQADKFLHLRQRLKAMQADFREGGSDFKTLMPQSERPLNRLASWRSWLGQYGQFLEGAVLGDRYADAIRLHVLETYIEPAREREEDSVEVLVRDVNAALGLKEAWPNICQALAGRKFREMADVRLAERVGANISPATVLRFDLAANDDDIEGELRQRYGVPIVDTAKMLAFGLPDGRQLAWERTVSVAQIWIEDSVDRDSCPLPIHRTYLPTQARHSNLPPRLKHRAANGHRPRPVLIVRPADAVQLVELLDWYEDAGPYVDRDWLDGLRSEFLERHPGFVSFEDGASYASNEGSKRRNLVEHAQALVGQFMGEAKNEPSLGASLLDLLVGKAGVPCELLDWRVINIVQALRTDNPGVVEQAAEDLAQAGDDVAGVMAFVGATWPLMLPHAQANPYAESRTISTMLRALIAPEGMFGIRSTPTDNACWMLSGSPAFGPNPLSEGELAGVMRLVRTVERIMRDEWQWAPRDLWDVQGFVWETCQKRLSEPEAAVSENNGETPIWLVTSRDGDADGFASFVERGTWHLLYDSDSKYNHMVREMQPGDRIVLRDYLPNQRNAPFETNGKPVSAMRIRAIGIVRGNGEDGRQVQVDWTPLPEPLLWWLYTNNDTIWRLPLEREAARKLAAFIFEGDAQDIAWFLNLPFWRDRLNASQDDNIMLNPTNLILFGPPGTGKTYSTAREAVRLCDGLADFAETGEGRASLMARYRQLEAEKRIAFVTFHQAYDYENFVEGLRPDEDAEEQGAGFRLKPYPGILREICALAEHARKKAESGESGRAIDLSICRFWKMGLGAIRQEEEVYEAALKDEYIALGWGRAEDWSDDRFSTVEAIKSHWLSLFPESQEPSNWTQTHRFRNDMAIGDIVIVPFGNSAFRAVGQIVGDYEFIPEAEGYFAHRRKVKWLMTADEPLPLDVIIDGNFTMRTVYEIPRKRINIPALSRLLKADEEPGERPIASTKPDEFVLVIDEINRANISKVFGELITLLEPDKRLGMPNALTVRLPYSKAEFGVPANLHVIGTMNTADRSIALLDTALRRRFKFREIAPDSQQLKGVAEATKLPLVQILETINDRIEYLVDREHRIGHAFFMGCNMSDDVVDVMRDKIIPLLQEYFFEDWSRVRMVLGDGFIGQEVIKAPPGMDGMDRERWFVRDFYSAEPKISLSDAFARLLGKGAVLSAVNEDDAPDAENDVA
ncbi:AAA family ATPase [Sphingobium sp. Ndbn-10]|uniref:AAA family ATPase n=1 Tax=Sphingobium sp. Ndbn-10 TaxID=1667223 RepID=UPI001BAE8501|nr:AAA family ATPase [Sphingobium sp. Ndbn-10]